MALRTRYSRWDGTQEIPPLDPDQLLEGLTDDLLNFGDLQHALRNMMQRGLHNPEGTRMQGLRDLLQQLRQRRRDALERFNLNSVFDDLEHKLDEILDLEQRAIEERLTSLETAPEAASADTADSAPSDAPSPPPPPAPMRDFLQRRQRTLEDLPPDVAGRIRELQQYEFIDSEAQQRFQELLDSLRQAMLQTFFKDLSQTLQDLSPADWDRMKQMVRDLNQMLQQRAAGQEPDFDAFMNQYGDLFGDQPPQSLDELIEQMQQQAAQMQNLLDSLPGDMRAQLQSLLADKIGDPELQAALGELAANLDYLYPMRDLRNQYPFRGEEEIDLQAALRLMGDMQGLDEVERQLERTQYGGDPSEIDADRVEELLGPEARETLDQLNRLLKILEDAGYIRKSGGAWELTPRGTRKIGQKALAEIYANLKKQHFGKHQLPEFGRYGERADDSKAYEFGDPLYLNLQKTIMNSVYREGPAIPVRLHPEDFEVYRSETLTQTATVLMLDLSWSMALRGSFQSAKRVALALNNLIRLQYPRDSLYLVGFSAYARELKPEQLPYVRWDETVLGTNMHHALMIAQQLLAKHNVGTRQIIMISDGEPTAHLERGRSYFAYPPSPITIRETLKEVKRCTKKGIVINTFMLDRNHYLKEFVNQVAKINKGRVFYTTPDKLGEYILVDFVANRRRTLRGA